MGLWKLLQQRRVKLGLLVALLVSTAWAGNDFGWDSLVAAIAALGAYLSAEMNTKYVREERAKDDKMLFARFLKTLPSNGATMRFLERQDLAAPFLVHRISEIESFCIRWSKAEYEFLDPVVEKKRKDLILVMERFLDESYYRFYPLGPGSMMISARRFTDSPEEIESQKQLNDLTTEIYNAHQELIRAGKRRLGP